MKNEQASDVKSPAPDKYFGSACIAGHDADHALYVVDPNGKMPLGIAMDPDGKHVYVANSESNYVSIINTENNSETARVELGTQPGKLLVDAKANLVYVSTVNEKSGQGSISTFGRDNFETISRIPTGPRADDMRLDRTKQRLYVQGFFDNSVYVVDLKKNRTTMWFKNRFTQPKSEVKRSTTTSGSPKS